MNKRKTKKLMKFWAVFDECPFCHGDNNLHNCEFVFTGDWSWKKFGNRLRQYPVGDFKFFRCDICKKTIRYNWNDIKDLWTPKAGDTVIACNDGKWRRAEDAKVLYGDVNRMVIEIDGESFNTERAGKEVYATMDCAFLEYYTVYKKESFNE